MEKTKTIKLTWREVTLIKQALRREEGYSLDLSYSLLMLGERESARASERDSFECNDLLKRFNDLDDEFDEESEYYHAMEDCMDGRR